MVCYVLPFVWRSCKFLRQASSPCHISGSTTHSSVSSSSSSSSASWHLTGLLPGAERAPGALLGPSTQPGRQERDNWAGSSKRGRVWAADDISGVHTLLHAGERGFCRCCVRKLNIPYSCAHGKD